MPFAAEQQRTKIPVTIITGFLGAGKTTLLNYLLKERGTKSIAVIENEFGEVNIDRELVADNLLEKEDLVSLENGCVCCSLRKDIVKAFAEIETRSKGRKKPLDAIIMETTGLADPAPVAFTFFANPWVASRFKLDSIMCVVDSRYLLQHLEDAKPEGAINEALQQIAFSDLILLNKIDLVSEEEKTQVLRAVKKINSTARLVQCQLNDPLQRPSVDMLLGINSFSINRALEVDPNFLNSGSETEDESQSTNPETSDSGRQAYGSEGSGRNERLQKERRPKRKRKKLHDLSNVSSVGIIARGPLDEYRFNMYMKDLLSEKARDIFRCKGVLCVHGYDNQKFVFQGVHETICYGPCDQAWKQDETRVNQMVFIGRGLNKKSLIEGFRTCVWVPLPDGWEEFTDPKTKQSYYCNRQTGEKSWTRPAPLATAYVTSTHASTEQPAISKQRKMPRLESDLPS